MSLFKNEVRNAVVKIIDERIAEAQEQYNESVSILAEETLSKIEDIQIQQGIEKQKLLKDCVASVLRV
jgi:hypothetical protein